MWLFRRGLILSSLPRVLFIFLVAFVLCADSLISDDVQILGNPSRDFSKHTVIKPKIYHGREKRQISTTREKEGVHTHHLTVGFEVEGRDYLLDLQLNRDLVPADYFIRYQQNGEDVVHKPTEEEVNLCQYSGHIRGVENSWAAISTCNGLKGVIYDGTKMHYVQSSDENDLESPHFFYTHDDLISNHTCGFAGHHESLNATHDHESHPHSFKSNEFNRILRYKRATPTKSQLRGPYNANKQSRYVELVLVVDNREYKALDEDLNKVNNHCKDIANIINSLYAPLNIYVALVGVVVWTDFDKIELSKNGDTTLTNFLHYRREQLVKQHPNDNAQLLTREEFEGGVVGKALKGPICTYEFSGGVAMDHSNVVGLVATTIAHEMGHNFGMEHDTSDCECPEDRCIMSPSSNSQSPTHWSSCSLQYLALAFEHGMDYCLKNKPTSLFVSPVCGNGFVESGEQCDCGLTTMCKDNYCCDPTTCMLYPNATCATGECCDLKTCRPTNAGSLCRSADRECDLPEYCTGQSEFCPDDVFKMDTEVCDGGKSFCYQGTCRTKSDQCRLLWGPSGESSDDKCYDMNKKGSRHGNCGYDKLKQKFTVCNDTDVFCGMLHCRHLNERLEFGMESVSILSHSFINSQGTIIPCRTAIVDLGLNQIDPGLVPDGAKCGDGKMCVNQKCMAVASLRLSIQGSRNSDVVCPSDCSGNGVCNSLGHCHCYDGFSPPHCDSPGPGGSFDSGPATDVNANKEWLTLLYMVVSGTITSILLITILAYYSRHNALTCWTKTKSNSPKSQSMGGSQNKFSSSGNCFGLYSPSNSIPTTVSPSSPKMSPDDMNSSLLPPSNSNGMQADHFFGHFKGFSLAPISKQNPSSGVQNENFDTEQSAPFVAKFNSPNSDSSGSQTDSVKNAINRFNNAAANSSVPKVGFMHATVHSPTQTHKVLPQRSAPPVPSVPTVTKLPNINRSNSQAVDAGKQDVLVNRSNTIVSDSSDKSLVAGVGSANNAAMIPAFPLNPAAPPSRPVISEPILEASTCSAKELISPLKHSAGFNANKVPLRQAPSIPNSSSNKRPLSSPNAVVNSVVVEDNKQKEGLTLNRLTSFWKQEKNDKSRNAVERSNSLPKNQNHIVKKPIDKNALKNLQISKPILINDIGLPSGSVPVVSDSEDDDGSKITRAQSMRSPKSPTKPKVITFGSMRQPSGVKRPTSIPVANRPTSPPPPRPDANEHKPISVRSMASNFQQNKLPAIPDTKSNEKFFEYDDCVAEKHAPLANITEEMNSDNIYAVIEESPPPSANKTATAVTSPNYNPPRQIAGAISTSTESMGLLGEIVNEIHNRNVESIYSTSTLARKKKEKEKLERGVLSEDDDDAAMYANTDHSEYSNLGGVKSISSNASTTSSGYLNPAAVNVPIHQLNRSSVGSDAPETKYESPIKPYVSTLHRPLGPFAASYTKDDKKEPLSISREIELKKNLLQSVMLGKTDDKSSLAKSKAATSPDKVQTNGPDVVSSCTTDMKKLKSPDVVSESSKVSGVNQGVILKPTLQNVKPVQPQKPSSFTAKPTSKQSTKPPTPDSNKPVLRSAPPPPNKKVPPPRPSLPKVIHQTSVDKTNSSGSLSSSKSNSIEKNLSNLSKVNSVPGSQKPAPKSNVAKRNSDGASKPAIPKSNSKPNSVANLQQKFEPTKNNNRLSAAK